MGDPMSISEPPSERATGPALASRFDLRRGVHRAGEVLPRIEPTPRLSPGMPMSEAGDRGDRHARS